MSNVTLHYGDTFTVQQYQYVTFEFGTDWGYADHYKQPRKAPGTPWAFRHAAVIAAKHLQFAKPAPVANLSIGQLVEVPEYGKYTLERDHNQNVKFVPATRDW